MNSPGKPTADLELPLPTRQFLIFLLLFHTAFLVGLIIILAAHFRRLPGPAGTRDFILVGLVATQMLLYLVFFAIPSFCGRGIFRWFQGLLGALGAPPYQTNNRPARAWWGGYLVASIAVVLAESRIQPIYHWTLIAYVGQISALSLRTSVPARALIFAAFLLNRFGWHKLGSWDAGDWLSVLWQVTPLVALVLFLGRTVVTSGERGRLIVRLEAAKRELELARQRDAELAALQERERLARDLHDSLGHSLVTLTVQLEAAQRLLATNPARVAAAVGEMQKLTRSSMEDLRRSLANLRAPGLGERPLAEALQGLCTDTGKRCGIALECQVAEGADQLPLVVAEVLWRVAQEGLANAEKHARARRIEICLALQPKEVLLRVGDDGVGLPPGAEDKPGHYGLRGLRERVEGVGGTFRLTAAQPRGTLVEARVPLIG
jgi:signal transduction histidine kinase